ncbi:MAG: sugar nucleotide-binding protein [Candidatus Omnitrophica bacterium]|nr:sugar nucleotide-binding protein [Candidatus Omnitrophota bacterium]
MKSKILILGKGFIGQRLQETLGCDISDRRINSFGDAEDEVKKYSPKIIINCIGFTGKFNVDGCEDDKEKTLQANTFVPIILAEVALRNNIKLIHISSGCIYHYDYSKQKPITERDVPDFLDLFYSRSKIYSDLALESLFKKYNILIVRIRVPFDARPGPRNTLTKLIKYKTIINIPNSVTYVPDFLKAMKHLIKIDAKGIFNVVNKGGLKYSDILDAYKKYVPGFEYTVVDFKKLKMTRTNLILSTAKLEKSGFKVRPIKEVIEECVKEYVKY